jgi:rhodanese-related sulfurtransferase
MKKLVWSFLFLSIAATGMLFADNNKNVKESLKQYLEPAALETLSNQIVNGEENDIAIIDVRPEGTYRKVHVPGAVNIPNGLSKGNYEELKSKDLVLYCETGLRVEFAKKNLVKDGFDLTRMLNFGGFSRYKGKTETGE